MRGRRFGALAALREKGVPPPGPQTEQRRKNHSVHNRIPFLSALAPRPQIWYDYSDKFRPRFAGGPTREKEKDVIPWTPKPQGPAPRRWSRR